MVEKREDCQYAQHSRQFSGMVRLRLTVPQRRQRKIFCLWAAFTCFTACNQISAVWNFGSYIPDVETTLTMYDVTVLLAVVGLVVPTVKLCSKVCFYLSRFWNTCLWDFCLRTVIMEVNGTFTCLTVERFKMDYVFRRKLCTPFIVLGVVWRSSFSLWCSGHHWPPLGPTIA